TAPRPPRSTLSPYTTLFRSRGVLCAHGEPRGIDPSQQLDGIVLGTAPQRRIEHAEQRPRVAVPTPRQVGGNGGEPCDPFGEGGRSEEHTSELQSRFDLVCRL